MEAILDSVIDFFNLQQLDWPYLLKLGGVLLLGCLLMGLFGRFVFGKKSSVSSAVSSAISIIFVCAVNVVLRSMDVSSRWLPAVPFVTAHSDSIVLFDFLSADFKTICSQVLSMVILAFLINLIDGWLPKKKNIFIWLFFRCLTVCLAYGLHLLSSWLFNTYMPQVIVTYAPLVLLALLVLMLLTGALKIIVGALIGTVNPVIGALYTFFFANFIGKQISKAMLTTTLLAGLVILLRYLGIATICIASSVLVAYIPFLLILVALWYLVNQIF